MSIGAQQENFSYNSGEVSKCCIVRPLVGPENNIIWKKHGIQWFFNPKSDLRVGLETRSLINT
jgi:hypothetical protein